MRLQLARAAWAMVIAAILLAPALLRLLSNEQRSLWSELAVLTGLLALSALVCSTVLPSRMRGLSKAFGIGGVLHMHRFLGVVVTSLVLAHIAFVVAANPNNVVLLDLERAPARAQAGVWALLALACLVALAVYRHRLRHRYEVWRWLHIALAAAVLLLSALHVVLLNHLIYDPAMRVLFVVLAGVVLAVLAYRWAWRPAFGRTAEYVVHAIRPENETVSTLILEPRTGRHKMDLPLAFAPGQFAWLRLDRSVAAEEHPFTIASGAHPGARPEFTVRHNGDFTGLLSKLQPGSPVWVDGPHGAFTMDFLTATGLVMIAGGVGITPMMSMLRTLAHRGDRRPHRLVVVAGDADELLFRDELAALKRRIDLTVVEVLRKPSPGWVGPSSLVDAQLLTTVLPGPFRRNQLDYFVCGPPALVTSVTTALAELAIPAPRVHTEQFDLV